jgi:hypothetical protein
MAAAVVFTLAGCAAAGPDGQGSGAAALRGFGVDVEQAIAPRVPMVHLKTCGSWGCHDQDVTLLIAGPTSAMPCPTGSAAPDTACVVAQLPGPGPGYGYAPVPALTFDPVTVMVTTPPGAPFPINTDVLVRPSAVCPDHAGQPDSTAPPSPRTTCPGATPQAQLRIAADGSVRQSR